MLEVASIVQEAVLPLGLKPIVVGGLALASWVPSGYLTADIDVIMPHTPDAGRVMAILGFEKDGRFWTLAGRDIVLEAPDSVLRPDPVGFEELRLPSGRVALVQSPEGVFSYAWRSLQERLLARSSSSASISSDRDCWTTKRQMTLRNDKAWPISFGGSESRLVRLTKERVCRSHGRSRRLSGRSSDHQR